MAHEADVASLGGGIDSGSGGAIGESAARTAPPDDVGGGRGGVGIRRQSRLKRGMVGLSGVFGFSRRGKTTPDGSSVELTSSSWFGTKRGGSAGGTGTDPGAASLGGGLTSAYGGAGADSRARKQVAGERRDRPTAARRIGQTLSVLPLSKVKIVIGKRHPYCGAIGRSAVFLIFSRLGSSYDRHHCKTDACCLILGYYVQQGMLWD